MTISVIIPTLNESACLAETLRAVRRQSPHEIIVVDGGSTDATADCAEDADLFLRGERGRAIQMNTGAENATGDVLIFLHADCVLEDGSLAEVETALQNPATAACCFTMRVRDDGMMYRSIEACATARVRLTGVVYGDQGLAVRRADFERIGGFPQLCLMEDIAVSRRLQRLGRIVVLGSTVTVSARRWQNRGILRQTLRNWWLTALALGGVHPDRLARFYPAVR